jgi:hypothetical protein
MSKAVFDRELAALALFSGGSRGTAPEAMRRLATLNLERGGWNRRRAQFLAGDG